MYHTEQISLDDMLYLGFGIINGWFAYIGTHVVD